MILSSDSLAEDVDAALTGLLSGTAKSRIYPMIETVNQNKRKKALFPHLSDKYAVAIVVHKANANGGVLNSKLCGLDHFPR
jgi:hypothetical protein